MRRSKAPSVLNQNKRFCTNFPNNKERDTELHDSDPEDESSFKWGSKENPKAAENEYINKNKRFFSIVWRDVTTKKHKTWKGDGTLEVNVCTMKAVLKDETGKYMGSTTRFKLSELQEDYQMVVSGKEIEIQKEIKDEEEIYELRKLEVKNRNWGAEEWVSPEEQAEEAKKPKGGFYVKPLLHLNSPKMPETSFEWKASFRSTNNRDAKWRTADISEESPNENECTIANNGKNKCITADISEEKPNGSTIANINKKWGIGDSTTKGIGRTTFMQKYENVPRQYKPYRYDEFICFIRPSELQQYLFQQINEYYTNSKNNSYNEDAISLNIEQILQQICNHPSFIKHITSSNKLVEFLTPSLPDWSEMGPFDSGKLEFVQYYIQPSAGKGKENLIIIAKSINTLNMLQGLCDFMDIKCFRICAKESDDTKKQILNEYFNAPEEDTIKILLSNSLLSLKECGSQFQKQNIIVFEDILTAMNDLKNINNLQLVNIYYLVTAFSIEELLLLSKSSNDKLDSSSIKEILNLYNTDFDDAYCYVHSKIECNCSQNTQGGNSNNDDLNIFKSWLHFTAPFDEQFLKKSGLDNSSENLVSLFSKIE